MIWDKPNTFKHGGLRKHFRSLKVPAIFGVEDGEWLDVQVEFAGQSVFGSYEVWSGGELKIPRDLAERLFQSAQVNPKGSIKFKCLAVHATLSRSSISSVTDGLRKVSATTREALIEARLGQGFFRAQLMASWNKRCAVTRAAIPALLRASHIKPWRLSNNVERLDPENGLLLIANVDAAFDAKLVSFSDNGIMLFSKKLGATPHSILGVPMNASLTRRPSAKQKDFLAHHREASKLSPPR